MVSNRRLPLAALPRGVSCAKAVDATTAEISAAPKTKTLFTVPPIEFAFPPPPSGHLPRCAGEDDLMSPLWMRSARLRDDIDERGLAFAHDGERTRDRRTEIVRILDRALAVDAERFSERGEVDVRRVDGGADMGAIDAALIALRDALHMHRLLMVRAVVVHDIEDRD